MHILSELKRTKLLQQCLQLLCRNSGEHSQDLVCLRPLSLTMAHALSVQSSKNICRKMALDISLQHRIIQLLAEWAVQIVKKKKGLKKVTKGSISNRLANVLQSYQITPQGTTGRAPSEMLLGRRPRTRLDQVKPHTAEHVEIK